MIMERYQRWLIPVLILFGLSAWVASPWSQLNIGGINWAAEVRQGLDLQGGVQVLLEADTDDVVEVEKLQTAKEIIEQRVNGLGVTEPVVQTQGDTRILVELPGVANVDEAVALVQQTALLEFVEMSGVRGVEPGTPIRTTANGLDGDPTDPLYRPDIGDFVFNTVLTGDAIESAGVAQDQFTNEVSVTFQMNDEGAAIFEQYTRENIGQILAIVLDGRIVSAPTIQSVIPGGSGNITGQFDFEEANALALSLRYGSLPIPLKVVNSRSVGATLGQDAVDSSILAGLIGFVAVAIFMVAYYRLPGFLAVLALSMYASISFALFKLIGVTLTLPGIAGFILSLGVAVDGNILIFERMKEELRDGRRIVNALRLGFERAWPSIRDSNVSTIITCTILWYFGNSFGASIVKGFAITLAIGVVVGLFSTLVATRTFMYNVIGRMEGVEDKKGLLGL